MSWCPFTSGCNDIICYDEMVNLLVNCHVGVYLLSHFKNETARLLKSVCANYVRSNYDLETFKFIDLEC